MRRELTRSLSRHVDVLEMLKIRCSSSGGGAPDGGALPQRRGAASGGRAPSRRAAAPPPPPQQQQQHAASYHGMDSWNVPRTPLSSFPETHQQLIRDGGGRRSSAARTAAPRAAPTPVQAAVDKALKVLAYEEGAGLADVRGSSGDRFCEWMARSLAALRSDLEREGHPGLAERCAEAAAALEGYGGGAGGSAARGAAVRAATAALTVVAHELQDHPHHMRSDRYSALAASGRGGTAPAAAAPESDDAAAAEAHAEETAAAEAAAGVLEGLEPPSPGPAEPDAEGYVLVGNRRIKAATLAFRESFAAAAAAQHAAAPSVSAAVAAGGEQRTAAWLALRERRLTASAFSKALGFFEGDRQSLWAEKVGMAPPFAGNEATAWGTAMEPAALDSYQRLTGLAVEPCMFRVKHEDPPHSWLGASPDGLVQGLVIPPQGGAAAPDPGGPGVLEIKCPFNRGRPDEAEPPQHAIWYYMPQIQGLMDIFDREWCCLYVWTRRRGAAAFRVPRDRAYWAAAFEVLGEFWWAHVVPARQARDAGAGAAEVEALRPAAAHPASQRLKEWSKRLAAAAPRTYYPPEAAGTGQEGPGGWGGAGAGAAPQGPSYRRKT